MKRSASWKPAPGAMAIDWIWFPVAAAVSSPLLWLSRMHARTASSKVLVTMDSKGWIPVLAHSWVSISPGLQPFQKGIELWMDLHCGMRVRMSVLFCRFKQVKFQLRLILVLFCKGFITLSTKTYKLCWARVGAWMSSMNVTCRLIFLHIYAWGTGCVRGQCFIVWTG